MLKELNVQYLVNKSTAMVLVGDETRVFTNDQPEYQTVKDLVAAGDEVGLYNLVRGLKDAIEPVYQGFIVTNGLVFIDGESVPSYFGERLKAFADSGSPYEYMIKFWENLKRNPSYKSVNSLYNFLENTHTPINKDGYIQAFKAVDSDLKDKRTHTIDNSPGCTPKMERRLISDDSTRGCHDGLHAGAFSYAKEFGSSEGDRLVEVLINPEHVVCVPDDASFRKMRVCEYYVVREVDKNTTVQPTNQIYDY